MAIEFTPRQKKVLEARGHDLLVSAAAGSGKTAVLVERIIRLITEGDPPMDVDRLLVVTFTRAAAAQMRERIAAAIEKRLARNPGDRHLQKQQTLVHHAQITTMDSFFTFLLRNNFSEIDLDPGFRQMDPTEADLLAADVMEDFLEEQYQTRDPAFLTCVDYFCPGRDDREMEKLIGRLYDLAMSHPDPEGWLEERRGDYAVEDLDDLFTQAWMAATLEDLLVRVSEISRGYERMVELCSEPGGPYGYEDVLIDEQEALLRPLVRAGFLDEDGQICAWEKSAQRYRALWDALSESSAISFARLPGLTGKKYADIEKPQKERVKAMRDGRKGEIRKIAGQLAGTSPEQILEDMTRAAGPMSTLVDLTLGYARAYAAKKREKNVIDFGDLEHFALQILLEPDGQGRLRPRPAALAYQNYFQEILIDEYQDSNEVQELLLRAISREEDGRGNRFMVGDVKQSIYKFRLARPEIFMEKYDTYREDDPCHERIDLDQNFRSRAEVLDATNRVFARIMRREIGGVEYDDQVSLKQGAVFPDQEEQEEDPYRAELLVIDESAQSQETAEPSDEEAGEPLSSRKKEALAVALRIRELVGKLPVQDDETHELRPARFGDVVILLRSAAGWNEEFRQVLEAQGIPSYVESREGYFAAEEIRQILQLLRVLDNPRQEIPLYGVLRGYFGGFTQEELSELHAPGTEADLYTDLVTRAQNPDDVLDALSSKCRDFLERMGDWRRQAAVLSIRELLTRLLEQTSYEDYCRALPGGEQRIANLHLLMTQANTFEQTDYTGLFAFLRYIDQLHRREVDYGEANILDEKADVVRIMTIHKSKGLEFPICFVCGMAKGYSFNRHDTSGPLVSDSDWGVGLKSVDLELRVSRSTVRREAIVRKIKRECLGEELRVLYVAMTRAKEKLILTGCVKDWEKKSAEWAGKVSSMTGEDVHLPVSAISDSTSYLDLVTQALAADLGDLSEGTPKSYPLALEVIGGAELSLGESREQVETATRRALLDTYFAQPSTPVPDPDFDRALQRQLSWRYAHEELQGLYTVTSVSELKMAAMRAMEPSSEGLDSSQSTPEGAHQLFPAEPEEAIPAFARQESEAAGPSGALHGTAIHRYMELFDYARFPHPAEVTEAELQAWMDELRERGDVQEEYAQIIEAHQLLPFLQDPIAQRMADASARGELFREQPFVLGVPASRLDPQLPSTETVMVQGIIDAFFEEEGKLVLLDYKTDALNSPGLLAQRYQVQIDLYAEALERILDQKVSHKLLFSFRQKRTIEVY